MNQEECNQKIEEYIRTDPAGLLKKRMDERVHAALYGEEKV